MSCTLAAIDQSGLPRGTQSPDLVHTCTHVPGRPMMPLRGDAQRTPITQRAHSIARSLRSKLLSIKIRSIADDGDDDFAAFEYNSRVERADIITRENACQLRHRLDPFFFTLSHRFVNRSNKSHNLERYNLDTTYN